MLEVVVPDGLRIGETVYGKGLFTTKSFKKGEIIYRNSISSVNSDEFSSIQFVAINNDGTTTIHDINEIHSVKGETGDRWVYTFDAFYNHSCDPNSTDISLNDAQTEYQMVALRDIQAGEELSCNYLLFDYECDGHSFDECLCGTNSCFKKIQGFKNLPYEVQIKLLPSVTSEVRRMFLRDHPEYVQVE